MSNEQKHTLIERLKDHPEWPNAFNHMVAQVTTCLMEDLLGPHYLVFLNLYQVARQARPVIADLTYDSMLLNPRTLPIQEWIHAAFPICRKLLLSSQYQLCHGYGNAIQLISDFSAEWRSRLTDVSTTSSLLAECVLTKFSEIDGFVSWEEKTLQQLQSIPHRLCELVLMMDGECEDNEHSMDTCRQWSYETWARRGFHVRQIFPTRDKMTMNVSWPCFILFLQRYQPVEQSCLKHIHIMKCYYSR